MDTKENTLCHRRGSAYIGRRPEAIQATSLTPAESGSGSVRTVSAANNGRFSDHFRDPTKLIPTLRDFLTVRSDEDVDLLLISLTFV